MGLVHSVVRIFKTSGLTNIKPSLSTLIFISGGKKHFLFFFFLVEIFYDPSQERESYLGGPTEDPKSNINFYISVGHLDGEQSTSYCLSEIDHFTLNPEIPLKLCGILGALKESLNHVMKRSNMHFRFIQTAVCGGHQDSELFNSFGVVGTRLQIPSLTLTNSAATDKPFKAAIRSPTSGIMTDDLK